VLIVDFVSLLFHTSTENEYDTQRVKVHFSSALDTCTKVAWAYSVAIPIIVREYVFFVFFRFQKT